MIIENISFVFQPILIATPIVHYLFIDLKFIDCKHIVDNKMDKMTKKSKSKGQATKTKEADKQKPTAVARKTKRSGGDYYSQQRRKNRQKHTHQLKKDDASSSENFNEHEQSIASPRAQNSIIHDIALTKHEKNVDDEFYETEKMRTNAVSPMVNDHHDHNNNDANNDQDAIKLETTFNIILDDHNGVIQTQMTPEVNHSVQVEQKNQIDKNPTIAPINTTHIMVVDDDMHMDPSTSIEMNQKDKVQCDGTTHDSISMQLSSNTSNLQSSLSSSPPSQRSSSLLSPSSPTLSNVDVMDMKPTPSLSLDGAEDKKLKHSIEIPLKLNAEKRRKILCTSSLYSATHYFPCRTLPEPSSITTPIASKHHETSFNNDHLTASQLSSSQTSQSTLTYSQTDAAHESFSLYSQPKITSPSSPSLQSPSSHSEMVYSPMVDRDVSSVKPTSPHHDNVSSVQAAISHPDNESSSSVEGASFELRTHSNDMNDKNQKDASQCMEVDEVIMVNEPDVNPSTHASSVPHNPLVNNHDTLVNLLITDRDGRVVNVDESIKPQSYKTTFLESIRNLPVVASKDQIFFEMIQSGEIKVDTEFEEDVENVVDSKSVCEKHGPTPVHHNHHDHLHTVNENDENHGLSTTMTNVSELNTLHSIDSHQVITSDETDHANDNNLPLAPFNDTHDATFDTSIQNVQNAIQFSSTIENDHPHDTEDAKKSELVCTLEEQGKQLLNDDPSQVHEVVATHHHYSDDCYNDTTANQMVTHNEHDNNNNDGCGDTTVNQTLSCNEPDIEDHSSTQLKSTSYADLLPPGTFIEENPVVNLSSTTLHHRPFEPEDGTNLSHDTHYTSSRQPLGLDSTVMSTATPVITPTLSSSRKFKRRQPLSYHHTTSHATPEHFRHSFTTTRHKSAINSQQHPLKRASPCKMSRIHNASKPHHNNPTIMRQQYNYRPNMDLLAEKISFPPLESPSICHVQKINDYYTVSDECAPMKHYFYVVPLTLLEELLSEVMS